MANTSIRTKEAIAQLKVNGILQKSIVAKITTVSIDPETEITKTRYVGQKRNQADLDVMGYGFSFSSHKTDRRWHTLWKEIETAENAGLPAPAITMTLTFAERNGQSHTIGLHGDCVVALKKIDVPENGYLVDQWEGYASYMT